MLWYLSGPHPGDGRAAPLLNSPDPRPMTGAPLRCLSLREVAGLLAARELSPVELTEHMLRRIEEVDPGLHSYATVTPERASSAARAAEGEIRRGAYRGPPGRAKGPRTGPGATLNQAWAPDSKLGGRSNDAATDRGRHRRLVLAPALAVRGSGSAPPGSHHPPRCLCRPVPPAFGRCRHPVRRHR
jgi:hypothetical protein